MFSSHKVIYEDWPILLVTHDAEDGAWQFINGRGDTETTDDAVLIHVEHVVELDPSVATLVDLPRGWHAWRESPEREWTREPDPD